MPKTKERVIYLVVFLILLAAEVCLAVFVHDDFIRPYAGDVLAVGVVYYFIRIFYPQRFALLPLYVFLIAVIIECLQLFNLAGLIGVENQALKIIIGSVFDWKDIVCYAIGCTIIAAIDVVKRRMPKRIK